MSQFLKTKEEIKEWLEIMQVENFIINDDLTVDVNNAVSLSRQKLKFLPVQFNLINGFFDCSHNELESLIGAPKVLKHNFICSYNKLKTLEGCPPIIERDFNCSYNQLENLLFGPEIVKKGSYYCFDNQLKSLKGGPKKVFSDFNCSHNKIENINDILYSSFGSFYCHDNPPIQNIVDHLDQIQIYKIEYVRTLLLHQKLEENITKKNNNQKKLKI